MLKKAESWDPGGEQQTETEPNLNDREDSAQLLRTTEGRSEVRAAGIFVRPCRADKEQEG